MPTTLTIRDETAAGATTGQTVVEFLTETVTVRDLIRARVYQEVDDHNRRRPESFRGLVTPSPDERAPGGPAKPEAFRPVDWKRQVDVACDAFARNGFFVLVDDEQADDLDDLVTLGPATTVSFVKLTPLVGG